jgi:hypothetical protein
MTKRTLPIGVQTFKKIREENYVYIDKTEWVHKVALKSGHYFLSRPRRFGKSLFVNTLKELFLGNEPLFRGLWIHDNWDWSLKHPVIHLSFDQMGFETLGLDNSIARQMRLHAEAYGIELTETQYDVQFEELLRKLHEKHGRVVVLVDEYDKPIVKYLEFKGLEQARVNQHIMKNFYAVLKASEAYLRLTFITGVSKFSKVSIFSDLNHLKDLTLQSDFSTAIGYTQQEIETHFEEYIADVQAEIGVDKAYLMSEIRRWYNGFSWDGVNTLYNPFGFLNFLDDKSFGNYWFTTGTPTFLLETMREKQVFAVENVSMSNVELEKYSIDNVDVVALLFQTGYLTVKSKDRLTGDMVLDYPNKEVRDSLYRFMIDGLSPNERRGAALSVNQDLLKSFVNNDLERIKTLLNSLLADLPSQVYDKQSEGLYHGLLHFVFMLVGVSLQSEVHSSHGQADAVVQTPTDVYIFEFKFNRSGKAAMQQIKNKNYADKYRASGKKITGIGVNFSVIKKRINGWEVDVL